MQCFESLNFSSKANPNSKGVAEAAIADGDHEAWKALSEEEKLKYVEAAEKAKAKFALENPEVEEI